MSTYDIMQNDKWFVVVDDKIGPRFDFVSGLSFAPDDSVMYLGENGDIMSDPDHGWILMLGNDQLPVVEGWPFDPAISVNFQTIAYVTIRNEGPTWWSMASLVNVTTR